MQQDSFEDWVVAGPPVFLWGARFMLHQSGTPLGWHSKWKSDGKLQASEHLVIVHEQYCKFIQTMICYDQLNGANCACGELIMRQLMLVEERLKDRFTSASSDAADEAHLFGADLSRANLCIAPALSEWVAEEVRKESLVLKERRKAREEHALSRPKANAK